MEISRQHCVDFDYWSALARHDPDAFEAMRRRITSELIEAAPPASRKRLYRLQWRIDQERRLARSPMGACIRISNLMWDSLAGSGGLMEQLEQLRGMLGRRSAPAVEAGAKTKVIPFVSGRR